MLSATCSAISSNLESVSCSKDSTHVKAKLVFSSATAAEEVSFRISGYQNYPSIEQYQINAHMYLTSLQQYSMAMEDISLINTQLSQILVNSYAFTNPIMDEVSSL